MEQTVVLNEEQVVEATRAALLADLTNLKPL